MKCERCNSNYSITFLVPDEIWAAISPHGDARGIYCLDCADELAFDAGVRSAEIAISFVGKAFRAFSPAAWNGQQPATDRAMQAYRT